MPMKLMLRVRPGAALTCASFRPSRELIRLDLPTLERPRKANSGGPSAGNTAGSAADVMNLAKSGFKEIVCHKCGIVSHRPRSDAQPPKARHAVAHRAS